MLDNVMLSVKDTAELKGCSERYIQSLINRNELTAIELQGNASGRGGIQYRIPLSALDRKLQLKYKRLERRKIQETSNEPPDQEPTHITEINLSAAEREEIAMWKQTLQEWRLYRYKSTLSMVDADNAFIEIINLRYPEIKLTRRTLYRKWKLLNESGETALVDKRGKHQNHGRKLKPEVWDIFEHFYLDESQKSVQLCRTLTELEIEKSGLDLLPLPSTATFVREANKIPEPYVLYFRHGEKVFKDKCEPYIRRMYEDLEPNDIWVADNHTFDVMVYDNDKVIRVYLTAFMDVRTRKMMGWCITDRPCADATLLALKKGIEQYGIPKMLYTDNGREFLFHDFGGNGFRKKKIPEGEFTPPTILKELGIEFKTALPRNARAKGIERTFNTFKNTFSKLFEAYTGGNVMEKPERLKEVVKKPELLKTVDEFKGFVDTYIRGWYNKQPHSGDGMYNQSPDEVFSRLLVEQRRATKEQLDLMFMRWSRPMKIGKNGITLTFYGKKLQYFDKELWANHFGKDVYVRYDPDDLSAVRVYDTEERFICTAQLDEELGYNATKEEIAKKQKEKRSAQKVVSGYKKLKDIQAHDELSLIMERAIKNEDVGEIIDPKVINLSFSEGQYKKAVGSSIEDAPDPDWTTALQNLKNMKG